MGDAVPERLSVQDFYNEIKKAENWTITKGPHYLITEDILLQTENDSVVKSYLSPDLTQMTDTCVRGFFIGLKILIDRPDIAVRGRVVKRAITYP